MGEAQRSHLPIKLFLMKLCFNLMALRFRMQGLYLLNSELKKVHVDVHKNVSDKLLDYT